MNSGAGTSNQDVFSAYKQAAERFQKACHAFRDADIEKAESEKALRQLSETLGSVIAQGLQDPTVPQVMEEKQQYDSIPNLGIQGARLGQLRR